MKGMAPGRNKRDVRERGYSADGWRICHEFGIEWECLAQLNPIRVIGA